MLSRLREKFIFCGRIEERGRLEGLTRVLAVMQVAQTDYKLGVMQRQNVDVLDFRWVAFPT